MRHAVIGIGSNSTRMLIGDLEGGNVTPLARYREGTRLFSGLVDGALSDESMMRAADAVARFVKEAQEQGATQLHLVATSATRDATNADAFAALVEAVAGVPLRILSGEEEARYSFMGGGGTGYCGLVDIGGGSTEIATGGSNRPLHGVSIQLGAVRLQTRFPMLQGDVLEAAYEAAVELTREAWEGLAEALPPHAWFGVGGTVTALASLDMELAAYDREAVHGHPLKRGAVENWARRLAKMTFAQREALPGMLPTRVDIIAHGAVVLWAVMEVLGIDRIVVSNRSNLDGYLLEIARAQGGDETDSVQKVRAFYDASVEREWARLLEHPFEFAINKHYIDRYVASGSRVLDVGGGPGRYSLHLAGNGNDVTLVDLSSANVEFALEQSKALGVPLQAVCSDARALSTAVEGTYDVVLLMGPLYHLLREEDRHSVIQACLDKLRPGGVLFVAFISSIGGMIYAGRELPASIAWEGEEAFYDRIASREDFAGDGFTSAFMIDPSNVLPLMAHFDLERLHLVGSEGVTAPFHSKIIADGPEIQKAWLDFSLRVCEREDLLCMSEHILYVGRKKGDA